MARITLVASLAICILVRALLADDTVDADALRPHEIGDKWGLSDDNGEFICVGQAPLCLTPLA